MRSMHGQFMRVTRSLAVVLAVALAMAGLGPASASAHYFNLRKMDDAWVDFGSDEDNTDHFLFWNHFVHYQMFDQYFARTDLEGTEQCRHCWNDGTDVVWFAYPIPRNPDGTVVAGDQVCRKVLANGACDRSRVRFLEELSRNISGAAGFSLVCHEVGHAAGLEHFNDGCMSTPLNLVAPSSNVLTAHMITHINEQY